MTNSKKLLKYIKGQFVSSDEYMSVLREGVRYIYEPPANISLVKGADNAGLIGVYARGEFYFLSDRYKHVGKDYVQELTTFEELYNTKFDKQMKLYSAQNPVGGKVSDAVKAQLRKFEKSDMHTVALDLIFGNYSLSEKPVDHSYFEPLFLRYLLLGNKSVDDAVSADIWAHADELNFAMLSEGRAYKHVAGLLQDEKMVEKISLYGKIRQSSSEIFDVAVDFENTIIKNIAVKKEQLLKMIKYDEKITYKKRLIISFDDIAGIECGQEIIYNKMH